jgi:hypothetical protein
MLTYKRRDADVQIIFISDENRDVRRLARDLDQSSYRILFTSHSSNPISMIAIWLSVSLGRPFLPTAIIVDYFCHGGRLVDIMCDLSDIVGQPGIELIIANAPEGDEARAELIALGADSIIQGEGGTRISRY